MFKKIHYHDTDWGGVVYYANYLKYFEEGRAECLEKRGMDLRSLAEKGILFVVRNARIDYKAPARYGDTIEIVSKLEKIKNASMIFLQEARLGEKLLVSAEIVLVCIDKDFRPSPIPSELK